MLDVDEEYGTPSTPKPLPTFKDRVALDVQNVFFNLNEFSEKRFVDSKEMVCITQLCSFSGSVRSQRFQPVQQAFTEGRPAFMLHTVHQRSPRTRPP